MEQNSIANKVEEASKLYETALMLELKRDYNKAFIKLNLQEAEGCKD